MTEEQFKIIRIHFSKIISEYEVVASKCLASFQQSYILNVVLLSSEY